MCSVHSEETYTSRIITERTYGKSTISKPKSKGVDNTKMNKDVWEWNTGYVGVLSRLLAMTEWDVRMKQYNAERRWPLQTQTCGLTGWRSQRARGAAHLARTRPSLQSCNALATLRHPRPSFCDNVSGSDTFCVECSNSQLQSKISALFSDVQLKTGNLFALVNWALCKEDVWERECIELRSLWPWQDVA
jgi:hypothetical protein